MIREEIISKRYADAFLSYAGEHAGHESALEELAHIKRIITDNPDLQEFLEHQEITNTEKGEVIKVVFANGFSDQARHFLNLLIEKKRIDLVLDIAEYARTRYAHGASVDALLKTSYPLDTDTIHRIKIALEKRMDKKVHLFVELDAEIGGGAYARIGNIIIDGSVKKRLEDMKDDLKILKVV